MKLAFESISERNLKEKISMHSASKYTFFDALQQDLEGSRRVISGHSSLEALWSFLIIWVYANDSELGVQSKLAVSDFQRKKSQTSEAQTLTLKLLSNMQRDTFN